MTLHTFNIKRCGDKLYKRLSAGRHFSDDTCLEAYANFINRLKKYRDKHPEAQSVNQRFVRNCERWITADLLRRRKRRRLAAAVEKELVRNALPERESAPGTGNTFMFLKLESLLSSWIKKKPKAASYARIFLLYNAWYISPRRVRVFARLADGKKSDFMRQLKAVRKYVTERFSESLREKISAAHYWHARSVKSDVQAREETGSRYLTFKQRKADCLARQRRAVLSLEKLKLKPPMDVLAGIAGVSTDRARYACEICLRELRKG